MKQIIPVHSFVDLITNSSSEIFVSADQDTVNAVKKLVNTLLTAGGGKLTADDLFTFKLAGNDLDVTAKDTSPDIVLAAQTLGNLTSLFGIDA